MSTAKLIVSDMLAWLKIDGDNYDSLHRKIKYLLNKNDSLHFITKDIVPKKGTDAAEENGMRT